MMNLRCADVARAALGPPTKREGAELLWHCPCPEHPHGDKNPSLAVNVCKQVWFCGPSGCFATNSVASTDDPDL